MSQRRAIFITGGASGLGEATARLLQKAYEQIRTSLRDR